MRALLPYIACAGLGVISALAMAPYGVLFALLCFGGVVLAVARAPSAKVAAAFSGVYAYGYFAFGLYWVQNALGVTMGDMPWLRPIALLGLPAILAAFWVVAGYITGKIWQRADMRAVGFIGVIAAFEVLRAYAFTGFPWNYFAYAWGAAELPAMQFTGLAGVHALNALTLFWAAIGGLWFVLRGRVLRFGVLALWALAGVLPNIYGMQRLMTAGEPTFDESVQAVIVQPNILQSEKWDADKQFGHFMQHIALSDAGLAGVGPAKTTIVLWPETAIDDYALAQDARMAEALHSFLRNNPEIRLVSGILRGRSGAYYNSIASLGLNDAGEIASFAFYDKRTLVPFGEYIPLVEKFGITPVTGFSGFSRGTGDGFLRDSRLPTAIAQICYEAIFPQSLPQAQDAKWIVNVSNDGWYGDTSGPYQHLMMSRYRAIEAGLPMLRSTTTGVSAVIDSYGRVLSMIPYGEAGILVSALPHSAIAHNGSRYVRGGIMGTIIVLWGMGLVFLFRRNPL